jgi:hypothetical protein
MQQVLERLHEVIADLATDATIWRLLKTSHISA